MQLFKRHASILFLMLLFQLLLYFPTAVIAQQPSSQSIVLVTLSLDNTPLHIIFDRIKQQTGLYLFYSKNDLADDELYDVHALNEPVETLIDRLVSKKGFSCRREGNTILINRDPRLPVTGPATTEPSTDATNKRIYRLQGQVKDSLGTPLPGATIWIKGTDKRYSSKEDGAFFISSTVPHPVLQISYTGYATQEYNVPDPDAAISVTLNKSLSHLDETIIVAYGTTSKRLNTGNVASVTAVDIEKYPVANPLLALQGRVPGLTVYQSSGAPGTPLDIRLRVQNSFLSNNEPLIVIDGIPIPAGNQRINLLTTQPNGSVGLLSSLNTMDIASIEILKDADATAIYGSRGGNGVIQITTKKGTAGKIKVTADYMQGFTQISKKLSLLDTKQYLEVRREAFRNDNITPNNDPGTPGYAFDIYSWDTTRYTDWQKWLVGGTAPVRRANIFMSGGNATTQLMLGAGYYREGTVYPSDMSFLRGNASLSVNHRSENGKLRIGLYYNYAKDKNEMFNAPLFALLLPPNAPPVYDANHQPVWIEGNEPFQNPLAEFFKRYIHKKENQLLNLHAAYSILDNLWVKLNLGYNSTDAAETQIIPKASLNPYLVDDITGAASFGNNTFKSYLAEPQAEYHRGLGDGELTIMAGASYQYTTNNTFLIKGQGYTNDALLYSIDGAAVISGKQTNRIEYKYGAVFGRATYKLRNKYIINLSGRRDGSSKFSPENRYSNFGAIGAAWIFSEEPLIKSSLPFLSFGKLRTSFGVTGNDQIADYKYLDTWSATLNPYQGITPMSPDALYNPNYNWERTKKLETALELEFFKDRLVTSIAYFRNRSDNQLLDYKLPFQTGFGSILRNFDALVQSSGWEFALSGDIVKTKSFTLNAAVNLSIPRNKLLRFVNLDSSSYNSRYVIGQSLNVLNKFQSTGVSPDNGLFSLTDEDGNGRYDAADYKVIGSLDPKYHGGIQLNMRYKQLSLSVLGDFRKQLVPNSLYSTYLNGLFPGLPGNQLDLVLDRWQQKGDQTRYPRYSTRPTGDVYTTKTNILLSDEAYSDGSFFKCRNVSVTYTINFDKNKEKTIAKIIFFCNAQNLFTLTGYKEGDPETAGIFSLPTLRTITGGMRVSVR
ncbi:SusC/RagA family TonB-linked outer membrane protein [Chitinophaga sp. S165]|uniref:SusC/RagA family TonB-linked outer membrane protein n=1 Tax=Chitinophaga sp. S165 TaxID=2135462 RepID=UPI000D716358|nr:SusC/RagA family TonB-linked outer membrane protein [Chitinophaga sp. S165]PWV56258.1 TonB-linked SusC/RagA family outer membrane protein [Chitinophaga sp. S165]